MRVGKHGSGGYPSRRWKQYVLYFHILVGVTRVLIDALSGRPLRGIEKAALLDVLTKCKTGPGGLLVRGFGYVNVSHDHHDKWNLGVLKFVKKKSNQYKSTQHCFRSIMCGLCGHIMRGTCKHKHETPCVREVISRCDICPT